MPLAGRLKEAVRPYYLRWLYFPLRPAQRPHWFAECWNYPFQKVAGGVRLTEAPSPRPDLLFYPMTDWHTRTQRTQQLARAFAGLGFRCIYINPHLGREFETTPLFDRAHRLAQLEKNVFELHIRLPREPVFHDRLLAPGEESIVAAAVRRILPERAGVVQMVSFPLWLGVARRFRRESGYPIVYDCHDLLSGFENMCGDMVAAEEELLRDADLVLFSSEGLMARYRVKRGLLVRNAVTASQFACADGAADPAAGQAVAGYVGALESWFDIEAVEQAARYNPQCRFVLAGRIEYEPIRRLAAVPNVELLGEVPYGRVPQLVSTFRIGLIPFRLNPLTLMTNPIKLYEYFSCGLPVVSTPLPEAQAMGDLVYVGSGARDFALQVAAAFQEDDRARRLRRKEIAVRENWTDRALRVSEVFHELKSGMFPTQKQPFT